MELEYPLKGESFSLTSGFGERHNTNHAGIDLKANSGTPVLAALPGKVVQSDDSSQSYGGLIVIEHDVDGETYYTKYAHLQSRYKNVNNTVEAGEKIGKSGGGPNDPYKGNSRGPHLHFELLDSRKKPINPEPYLKGTETLTGNEKEKNKENTPSDESETDNFAALINAGEKAAKAYEKFQNKTMGIYTPLALVGSLGSGVKTESELPKAILEDIENIKRLIK